MVEKEKSTRPLEIVDSTTYRYIIEALYEKQNIHSYDVEILAREEDTGLMIILKFGENFSHSKKAFFQYETLKKLDEDFVKFIDDVTEECKKVMVAEYFKMMKP